MIDIKSLPKQDAQTIQSILKKDKNSITSAEWEILKSRKGYLTPAQLKTFFGKRSNKKAKAKPPVVANPTIDKNNSEGEHAK